MGRADVVVLGAGALGWGCAEALAEGGAAVTLLDPGGSSASAVAAGMLAPAFESALDGADEARAALLRAARDAWPAVAERRGLTLDRAGALWPGEAADDLHARLTALGFAAARRGQGVFTPEDWSVDPAAALGALPAGVRRVTGRARRVGAGSVELDGGERLAVGRVVLAVGVGEVDGAPPLAAVVPIKGQIARLAGVAPPPCMLRGPSVYVVPRGDGVVVGATMEPGVTDIDADPDAIARLLDAGSALWPAVRDATQVDARAGVRGATADGLPLVGPVARGLSVALAPRRNGWLLAPLVGRMIAAYAADADPGPHAEALDPFRVQPS